MAPRLEVYLALLFQEKVLTKTREAIIVATEWEGYEVKLPG